MIHNRITFVIACSRACQPHLFYTHTGPFVWFPRFTKFPRSYAAFTARSFTGCCGCRDTAVTRTRSARSTGISSYATRGCPFYLPPPSRSTAAQTFAVDAETRFCWLIATRRYCTRFARTFAVCTVACVPRNLVYARGYSGYRPLHSPVCRLASRATRVRYLPILCHTAFHQFFYCTCRPTFCLFTVRHTLFTPFSFTAFCRTFTRG